MSDKLLEVPWRHALPAVLIRAIMVYDCGNMSMTPLAGEEKQRFASCATTGVLVSQPFPFGHYFR